MVRLPNLLASRRGRLSAFFFLYMTEGIPLGFAAVAVTAQLRRMGVGPAEIGAFVASFYLPWAFKWAFGPFVDVLRSARFGHRRGWILLTQLVMAATLLALVAVPLPQGLALFTAVLLVHNTFAAMQDVAIDGLAVNTLQDDERGLANGLMFAGAAVGQAVGGSGVLFLIGYLGLQSSFVAVALSILAVTTLVVLPMKEALIARSAEAIAAAQAAGGGVRAALAEMRDFARQSFQSFLGTRGAYAGLFFALLPAGAMSLGLALQSNLAVELGFSDESLAQLNLASSITSAVFMVVGGWLSDRFGRRRTLAVYLAAMSLPVLWLMWQLQQHGYVMPRTPGGAVEPALVQALWVATVSYNVCLGLMYGTRSAIMMDVTNPRVAGTQFTAYMAMMNLAIAISATWQGLAIEAFGYPLTLAIDAALGLLCILLLPAMGRTPAAQLEQGDGRGALRARNSALGLALLCLAWLPFNHFQDSLGAARPMLGTLFTLVFIASALFLYAGSLQGMGAGLARASRWLALLLLALYARYFIGGWATRLGLDAAAVQAAARWGFDAVALAAALLLLALARRSGRL